MENGDGVWIVFENNLFLGVIPMDGHPAAIGRAPELWTKEQCMYFNQISVDGMGCLSYVIGCPRAKAMAVADPKRDVQDYLTIAREVGMQITHVFNTHLHADHVSGDQELQLATGADIYSSRPT
jgi:glyoxylase-like metal-dependent hydrolase (beta-lactamase superfamily II)